jgi:hypothetical protein
VQTQRLNICRDTDAVHQAYIRILVTLSALRVEGPFNNADWGSACACQRWFSQRLLAAIIRVATSAGLALSQVMNDVVVATGSRVEPRAVSSTAHISGRALGALPTHRYIYGQDVSVVGSPEGLHDPGSLSWLHGDREF